MGRFLVLAAEELAGERQTAFDAFTVMPLAVAVLGMVTSYADCLWKTIE